MMTGLKGQFMKYRKFHISAYLPTIAPMARDGMNSPAGILMPKVKMVMMSLKTRARASSQMAV